MSETVYNKAINIIENCDEIEDKQRHINFILASSSCGLKQPYLLDNILSLLDDYTIETLSYKQQLSLIRLSYRFNKAYNKVESLITGFEKMAKYVQEDIYYVHLESGDRVATENEIKNGVEELFTQKKLNIGEQTCKIVTTLSWAITGSSKMYTNMGKQQFTELGTAKTFMELLKDISNELLEAIVVTENTDKIRTITRQLRELKKRGLYVYPKVARDEIVPDVTLQSIVNGLKAKIPKDTTDKFYIACLDIIRKNSKNHTNYSPKQIALLKNVYNKLLKTKEHNKDLYTKCTELLKARDSKTLDSNEFVFRILYTLSKNNYSYASEAQIRIIDEAYAKLDTITRTAKGAEGIFNQKATATNTIYNLEVEDEPNEMKTLDLSDMLGQGLFTADIMQI